MADPYVNGVIVPESMRNTGVYRLIPVNTTVRNGKRELVNAGQYRAEWYFSSMDKDEFDWWAARVGNALSATLTGNTILWPRDMDADNMITFTNCVLDYPDALDFKGNVFIDVTIRFHGLVT